ncbi:MAG: hypothetical protein F6J99_27000 [Moorea sp. SIO4G3]|nr:hypothetical protein [Moorena sp. SIO4G3]
MRQRRTLRERKVIIKTESDIEVEIRLDELAKSLSSDEFEEVHLKLEQPKSVWVATLNAKLSRLEGERTFAIVMNASSIEEATDIDYLITNVNSSKVTAQWVITTYSQFL